jgi:DNA repair exonuclease SbcCD nuclease subunit
MKLLLCADVHLDAPFVWAGPGVGRARRSAIRDTLQRVIDLALSERVDALCLAGDLYEHERAGPDTGEFLREAFAGLACPVLIAPGNHDWFGPASLYRHVRWTPNVRVFDCDRFEPHELTAGFTVWGAAHRAPANTDGFLSGFRVDRGGTSVGLFHGSERAGLGGQGAGKVAHAPFAEQQIERSGLAHALVGHFHRASFGAWHTYPGNPEPLSFGETGERGAVLIDVAAGGAVRRCLHAVSPTVWSDVEVTVRGARHAGEIREQVRETLRAYTGLVRLTVRGEVAPSVQLGALHLGDAGELAPHLEALVVRPLQLRHGRDLDALAQELTVRGSFVRDVLASGLPMAQQQRVLAAGLLALDGRASELAAG